jgi:hypothetical protein
MIRRKTAIAKVICDMPSAQSRQSISFFCLSFAEQQDINQLISRVYIGRGDMYRIEWSFGGAAQSKASEWHAKKAKIS